MRECWDESFSLSVSQSARQADSKSGYDWLDCELVSMSVS